MEHFPQQAFEGTEGLSDDLSLKLKNRFAEIRGLEIDTEVLQKTAAELISFYEIGEATLTDPNKFEMFVAISESYARNTTSPEADSFESEKMFLDESLRALCGNNSIKTPEENDRIKSQIDKIREYADLEATEKLKGMLSKSGDGSMLNDCRKNLGIEDLSFEKPFEVVVLSVSRFKSLEGQSVSGWEHVTGSCSSEAFVLDVEGLPEGPILVFSADTYKEVVDPIDNPRNEADKYNREYNKRNSRRTIAHEYVHTQARYRLGADNTLGRIFDENLAIRASGSGGHSDAVALLTCMSLMTSRNGETPIFDAFKQSLSSDAARGEFLKVVTEHFGPRSTLLLMALQPKGYGEQDVIVSGGRGVNLDPKERPSALFYCLYEERKKRDPDMIENLRVRIADLDDSVVEGLNYLLKQSGIKLPPDISEIFNSRLDGKS